MKEKAVLINLWEHKAWLALPVFYASVCKRTPGALKQICLGIFLTESMGCCFFVGGGCVVSFFQRYSIIVYVIHVHVYIYIKIHLFLLPSCGWGLASVSGYSQCQNLFWSLASTCVSEEPKGTFIHTTSNLPSLISSQLHPYGCSLSC